MNILNKGWAVALVALGFCIQVNAEKLLIDFGDAGSYRSVGVSSPDINGNYWNGVGGTNSVDITNLVDTANAATAIDFSFISDFGVDSYNGPAGNTDDGFGDLNPGSIANTTFNSDLLGDLGVTNAVFDFVAVTPVTNLVGDIIARSNVVFRLADLDPSKYYELTLYGSRKYPSAGSPGNDVDECSVRYSAIGGSGTVAADLHMGVFDTHNPLAVASLVMTPGVSNDIEVVISAVTTNSRASLNAMSIEVLDAAPVEPEVRTMLVDFNSTANRGLAVDSPDSNGNVWNGYGYQPVGNIIDTENRLTSVDLIMTSSFGSDSYNGPAGATSFTNYQNEVTNTVIDAVALGDLGVTNAAFDYFSGSDITFELRNLDPSKSYDLTFFGSHKYNSDNFTQYAVTDSTGMVLVATNLLVGVGADHNTNTVVTLTNLTPDASNTIYVQYGGVTPGTSGYLNSMKIQMQSTQTGPEIAPVITDFIVSGSDVTLTWTADSVGTYSIQRKTDLNAATWTDVLTGLPAGGGTTNVTASGASEEFYQIYGE